MLYDITAARTARTGKRCFATGPERLALEIEKLRPLLCGKSVDSEVALEIEQLRPLLCGKSADSEETHST